MSLSCPQLQSPAVPDFVTAGTMLDPPIPQAPPTLPDPASVSLQPSYAPPGTQLSTSFGAKTCVATACT